MLDTRVLSRVTHAIRPEAYTIFQFKERERRKGRRHRYCVLGFVIGRFFRSPRGLYVSRQTCRFGISYILATPGLIKRTTEGRNYRCRCNKERAKTSRRAKGQKLFARAPRRSSFFLRDFFSTFSFLSLSLSLFVELHEKARKNLALTRGVAVEVDAHEGHEFVGNNVGHLN